MIEKLFLSIDFYVNKNDKIKLSGIMDNID
jgi:hypothetical protein